ncbi:class I SAM-dependent methyltransferase [Novispirillum sp. DQ9]|uniref:class I SAM-dependent methyltransferase n=1 Tax=Novispirillum sp. DQ9 TaxID=3398612 RepID=UPI003C797DC0
MTTWNEESIKAFADANQWYHKIDLGHGIVTKGLDFEPIWDNIRKTRSFVDYTQMSVLDIGTWDGLWAFEAEKLGAKNVIATDVQATALEKFLTCREILGSKCLPFYNVSPYKLFDGLMPYLHSFTGDSKKDCVKSNLFDIVQHFGVLYHLRDPLLSLSQARSVMKTGGTLILETAILRNEDQPHMAFNCNAAEKKTIYDDITTWWAPSPAALSEMLRASMFEPLPETQSIMSDRLTIAARAVGSSDVARDLWDELGRDYRNPGLASHIID